MRVVTIAGMMMIAAATGALGQQDRAALTDQQIAVFLVQQSRDRYASYGRPCQCPDDISSDGSRCGQRSAYNRLAAAPFCYVTDVTKAQIDAFRRRPAGLY